MDQNTNGRPPMPFPDDGWRREAPVNDGIGASPASMTGDGAAEAPVADEAQAEQAMTEAAPLSEGPMMQTDAWAAASPANQQAPEVEQADAWTVPAAPEADQQAPEVERTDVWAAAAPVAEQQMPTPAAADAWAGAQAADASFAQGFEQQEAPGFAPAQEPYRGAGEQGAIAAATTPTKQKSSTLKPLLMGVLGGALATAGVTFALGASGVAGSTKVVHTSDSAAGQTIHINANTEDTTIAKAVAAKALPSVVSVYVTSQQGQGLGSGAVLDKDGNIITNNHVVEGADAITVTIAGKSYDATLVGTDPSSDLAVVHAELNGDEVTPMEVGDSDQLVVGDWVMTLGSPFGLDQSVSAGIVSSLSRNQLMASASGNTLYTNLIQTDAAINPGNSGGPMVNAEGKLVGIDTLFSSDTESFAGIGFAIPGNYAMDIAQKIIAGEPVTHAYIGLSMQTVNAQNAQENHLSVNQGAYVAEVAENGPAAQAGIEKGDIIISLDGQEITSADGMILAVRTHKIGETVEIKYMHGDEEKTAKVTFGDDAELQKTQESQREQQQQQQQQDYGIESPYGERRDYGEDVSYQDIIDYLFNNNSQGQQRNRR